MDVTCWPKCITCGESRAATLMMSPQLSLMASSWASRRDDELDRVLALLSRLRDMKEAASKLDLAARRQERLDHEERQGVVLEARRGEIRAAKAGILAGLKQDMQAARAR